MDREIANLNGLRDEAKMLSSSLSGTAGDIDTFNDMRRKIIDLYPELKDALGKEVNDVNQLDDAYRNMITTLEDYAKKKSSYEREEAYSGRYGYLSQYNDAQKAFTAPGVYERNASYGNVKDAEKWLGHYSSYYKSKDKWNYQDFSTAYLEVEKIRNYLAEAGAPVNEANALLKDISAGMQYKFQNIVDETRSSIDGLVRGALNVEKIPSELIPEITDTIVEQMMDSWWRGELTDPLETAMTISSELDDYIAQVEERVAQNIETYQSNPEYFANFKDAFTRDLMTYLENAPVKLPNEMAKSLLQPWFEAIGESIDSYAGFSELADPLIEGLKKEFGD